MIRSVAQQQLLSNYLKPGKKVVKDGKLDLFGKTISVINSVSVQREMLDGILEIDLTHNGVCSIENIEQFQNVQMINISHNKIVDVNEILKLKGLSRLNTLYIKKNPFVKDKLSLQAKSFILSLYTDIQVVDQQIGRKIEEIVKQKVQLCCFSNYLNKLRIHMELMREGRCVGIQGSMFPKIKKVLEGFYQKNINIRRHFVNQIEEQLFQKQTLLLEYLNNQLESIKQNRSKLIKTVYQLQQQLKADKISVMSKMSQWIESDRPQENQYSFKNVLKEHKKSVNQKMRNVVDNLKKNTFGSENSPSKYLTMSDIKEADHIQHQFMNILTKVNPLFHLLYSPLSSLKNHEKECLIPSLASLLKEKMKENYKLQKMQKEYSTLKYDFTALQEHLECITIEVKQQQQTSNERIKRLTKLCQQQSNKVDELQETLKRRNQQLEDKRKEGLQITNQLEKDHRYLVKMEKNQELEEIIRDNRSKNQKYKYLTLMKKKAYHLCRLKFLHSINQSQRGKRLMWEMFKCIKMNTFLRQGHRQLKRKVTIKYQKELTSVLIYDINILQREKGLKKFLCFERQKRLISWLGMDFNQRKNKTKIVNSFIEKRQRNIKIKSLKLLKDLLINKYQQQMEQNIKQYRKQLSIRKIFRTWLRYMRDHQELESRVIQWVRKEEKGIAMGKFIIRCKQDINYMAQIDALSSFLVNFRKIKGYFTFTKITGRKLLTRQIKSIKANRLRQYNAFQFFVQVTRDKVVKRRIQKQEERRRHAKEIKQGQRLLKKIGVQKRLKMEDFRHFFCRCSLILKRKMMVRCNKSEQLKKGKEKVKLHSFFSKLKTNLMERTKMNLKVSLIKKSRRFTTIFRHFFIELKRCKQLQNQIKLRNDRKVKLGYFYRWKSFLVVERVKRSGIDVMYQKQKMQLLERQSQEKHELLMNELNKKQMLIQDYMRRCGQYEYTLESKDIKYEKLKHIYEETVGFNTESVNPMNNTVKFGQSKIFQKYRPVKDQSLYIKYLPSDIREAHYNKADRDQSQSESYNAAKNQTANLSEHHLLKTQPLDYSYNYKDYENGNKFSFVSSFRKF